MNQKAAFFTSLYLLAFLIPQMGKSNEKEVLAIFEERCADCHRDDEFPELHGDTKLEELKSDSDTLKEIVKRINLSGGAKKRMPRSRGAEGDESYRPPLSRSEITLLENWVKNVESAADPPSTSAASVGILPNHNTQCPIDTGQPVDPEVKTTYAGRTVYFCCKHCLELFQIHANYAIKAGGPERLPQFAGMEKKLGLNSIQLLDQRFCPVEEGMLILPGNPSLEYNGETVYFSDEAALKEWQKSPEKYAGPHGDTESLSVSEPLPKPKPETVAAASVLEDSLPDGDIELQARYIFNKRCQRCHNPQKRRSPDLAAPLSQILESGDYDLILSRVTLDDSDDDVMPPVGPENRHLTDEEIAVLRKWFSSGEKDRIKRDPIYFTDALRTIYEDVRENISVAKYYRYLTLTNIYNTTDADGYSVYDDHKVETLRVAISKLMNSLSTHGKITVPEAIDDERTIFRIDLRDYKWTADDWERVAGFYPHGIVGIDGRKESKIFEATGSRMPYIRADWFGFAAAQPPLYDDIMDYILGIYTDGNEGIQSRLEKRLGVDRVHNIQMGDAVRAGFINSGVSDHNRLIERHESDYGSYWVSYDFQRTGGGTQQDLRKAPMGPPEAHIAISGEHVFDHDGGEMIYTLPNGLQGYLLANAQGTRLDRAPVNIVRDKNRPDGVIINGISCIKCHDRGMKAADRVDFPPGIKEWDEKKFGEPSPRTLAGMKDEIRPFVEKSRILGGTELGLFEKLYPPKERLRSLILHDYERFNDSLGQAIGDHVSDIEPVSALYNSYYLNPINAYQLSAEFGLDYSEMMSLLEEESFRSESFRTLYQSLANGTSEYRDQMMLEYISIVYVLGYQLVPFEPLGYEEFGGKKHADLIRDSRIFQQIFGKKVKEAFDYDSTVTKASQEKSKTLLTSSDLAVDRQSHSVVLLPDGGRMEVEVTPSIKIGEKGVLRISANRSLYLNVLHRGAGVGVTQFFPNDNLKNDRIISNGEMQSKVIEFVTSPPSGAEYFEVYASTAPISVKSRGEKAGAFLTFNQSQIFNSRGIATAISATDTSKKKSEIQPSITKAKVGYILKH